MTPGVGRKALTAATAVAAVLLIAAVPLLRRGPRYPFEASSAAQGYAKTGRLGDVAAYGVLFHTNQEREPWVEIDLAEERPVRAVEITNRYDCCKERALPLVLEIAGTDRQLHEVARVTDPFDEVTLELPGAPTARYVRLRVAGTTMFHLAAVRVR
jgi:hypothetical protein